MAVNTTVVHNGNVKILDRYDLIVGIESECRTMVETVDSFCKVFVQQVIMWAVTIIACGNTRMGRMPPGIELILHNMAVDTGTGIVRKVGMAFCLDERVSGHPPNERNHSCQDEKHSR